MRRYVAALLEPDFARLFLGATANSLGDGMSFVAMTWLVVNRPHGTEQLGLFVALYTAPVFVGGWLAGVVLDRFDKRHVIAADALLRAAAFASIPLTRLAGISPDWLVFAVAALYGLLKMIPLAGFPSAIPDLVDDRNLDAANALEGLSYGAAGVIGPAAAGLAIPLVGSANVLYADAASYLLLAAAALSVRKPLVTRFSARQQRSSLASVLRFLATDVPIASTTLAFMTCNIALGMLLVTGPWLAHEKLGGPTALGWLMSSFSIGELGGSLAAGAWSPRRTLIGIGAVELAVGAGLACVAAWSVRPVVALGYGIVGFFGAPMTIWAQSMRMRRLPPGFRGRAFASLRTLMQATPPVGAAIAAPLLSHGMFVTNVASMAALVLVPAIVLVVIGSVRGLANPPLGSLRAGHL